MRNTSQISLVAASLAREMVADADRLAHLRVDTLNGVGGAMDFAHFRREGEERYHLLLITPPALRDGRIFLAPWLRSKSSSRDPCELYVGLTRECGTPAYEQSDAPASVAQKKLLERLAPEQIHAEPLAGEPIRSILANTPGNQALSARSKLSLTMAGSPTFRRRPRRFTKSTLRAFAAVNTSSEFRKKHSSSSRTSYPSGEPALASGRRQAG